MASCSRGQSCSPNVCPLNATIRSPARNPAAAAGVGGAPGGHCWLAADAGTTHALTALIVVVEPVGTPMPISTIANSTTARIRFMNGPANITTMRFHGARR